MSKIGGRQGAQVMEHWGSDATQVVRKGIPLCVYQFYFVLCVYMPVGLQRPEEEFPSPGPGCEKPHGAGN